MSAAVATLARVDSIPGLEILANDVRCTHGATAGQIDPAILFYLMSRGLTKFQARKMIMDGFFEEVVLRFGLESVTEPPPSVGRVKSGAAAPACRVISGLVFVRWA